MAEDQKNGQEEFKSFCEGIPLEDMMRKMIEAKKSGTPFNCPEIMSQMIQKCCDYGKKKEEAKENPVPNPSSEP